MNSLWCNSSKQNCIINVISYCKLQCLFFVTLADVPDPDVKADSSCGSRDTKNTTIEEQACVPVSTTWDEILPVCLEEEHVSLRENDVISLTLPVTEIPPTELPSLNIGLEETLEACVFDKNPKLLYQEPSSENVENIVFDMTADGEVLRYDNDFVVTCEEETESTVQSAENLDSVRNCSEVESASILPGDVSDGQVVSGDEAVSVNNELNELTHSDTEKKIRKGRKRKFPSQNKEIAKIKRNSNQEHYDYEGKLVMQKSFKDFHCSCLGKCYNAVSAEVRNDEFVKFWELKDYNSQNMFIGACVKEVDKKRNYSGGNTKRKFTRVYTLRSVTVCRDMFVETLRVSTKRVNTALCKLRTPNNIMDRRGKVQGGANKINNVKLQEIKTHINKLPRYKSHYRRAESDSEYLPPEMTLQKMYDLYTEETSEPVSFSTYRRIFLKHFNLKFKHLKKDTCNICDSYAAKASTTVGETKTRIEEEHSKHKDSWMKARLQLKNDSTAAKQNTSLECITFDLEKTLPLPRIPTNIIFYKRQLWVYNAGVHSCKTESGFCYVWVENEAGRGAQEIGSCLIKHIEQHVGTEIKHLILWCDSCGGQNRNIKMILILKACLEAHPSLDTIYVKYLVSGHSFLPNDADFSDIECALKHVQRLYLPSDYVEVMKKCRRKKPFCVTRMKAGDFWGTEKLEKIIVNRKVDAVGDKINWLHFREIKITKEDSLTIFARTDFESPYHEIDISRKPSKGRPEKQERSFRKNLVQMWTNGKDIAAPKLKDIKSVMHLIPSDAKHFYLSLSGSRSVEDDVEGYCAPLDFDVDNDDL